MTRPGPSPHTERGPCSPSRRPGAARSRWFWGCSPRRTPPAAPWKLCSPRFSVIALREVDGVESRLRPPEPQPALPPPSILERLPVRRGHLFARNTATTNPAARCGARRPRRSGRGPSGVPGGGSWPARRAQRGPHGPGLVIYAKTGRTPMSASADELTKPPTGTESGEASVARGHHPTCANTTRGDYRPNRTAHR